MELVRKLFLTRGLNQFANLRHSVALIRLRKTVVAICLLSISSAHAIGEKLAIVGVNTSTTDGFTFVAIDAFTSGQKIYFTDNEFNGAGSFTDANEGTWEYTAPAGGFPVGGVVQLQEPATANTLEISCSFATGPACGTVVVIDNTGIDLDANPNVSIAGTDAIYAYSDNNNYPADGITGVYAATIRGTFAPSPTGASGENVSPLAWAGNPETAVVVDGFASTVAHRDFKNVQRTNTTIGQLISPANFDTSTTFQALDLTPFTFSSGTNPELSIVASPTEVSEDGATDVTYTFSLNPAPSSAVTINFNVSGNAVLNTDYTASSAATFTFNAGTGTIVVPTSGSASITVDPTADSDVEPFESVTLTGVPASGYDLGSVNVATGTIVNDDTSDAAPMVALSGLNHTTNDGFSFVALTDITAGEIIRFTDKSFNNTILQFTGAESVMRWDAPSGVQRGDVIVVFESSSNVFDISCTDGTGAATCGTIALENGTSFSISGEEYYAISDSDSDPNNGVTQIHAVLNTRGPVIPATEDPSAIWQRAVVVSNFDSVFPGITNEDRVEYKFAGGERAAAVTRSSFTNINNWLYAATPQNLSSIPFANINIGQGPPVPRLSVAVSAGSVVEDAGGSLTYTFTLDTAATTDLPINFSITGVAINGVDYTTSTNSPLTLLMGQTSVDLVISPIADTTLEPDETVTVTVEAGSGYEPATVSSVTANIVNDDVGASMPLVSIVGVSALDADGLSFVLLEDLAVGTNVYFTDRVFDRTSLSFPGTGDGIFRWTAPANANKGDVYVFREAGTSNTVDTLSCSDGTGASCGTVTLVAGTFTFSNSEGIYAYSDTDDEPNNGVSEVYAATYPPATFMGVIPEQQDPRQVYPDALVMDGFSLSTSSRYEYDPGKRGMTVSADDLQNTTDNWVVQATTGVLSTVPFSSIALSNVVVLSASTTSGSEAVGTQITLTVTASEAVVGNQTVDVSVTGPGISLTDYTLSSSSITINSGMTTGSVTLTVNDDSLVEALMESATVSISNPSAGIQLGDTASVNIDIADNDSATVSVNDVTVAETDANTTVFFQVSLSAQVDVPVSLQFSTADATATAADNDFTAITNQPITFAANSAAGAIASVAVFVNGDNKVELDETASISLTGIMASGRAVTFADPEGALTITNDDTATVSVADVTQNETDLGSASFDFIVTLSAPVDTTVSLTASTNDGTATAGSDYTALMGSTVQFSANSVAGAQQTVLVQVAGDEFVELDEGFTLSLSAPDAGGRSVSLSDGNADATIVNDDTANVSINDTIGGEGDSGPSFAQFNVRLDASVDHAVSVNYSVTEGTATLRDADFADSSGTVTFDAGSVAGTLQPILIELNGDTKVEADETFFVNLSALNSGMRDVTLTDEQGAGTIADDDSAQISLAALTASVTEGNDNNEATNVTYTVTLDNAVDGGFQIDYASADGSATVLDNDYMEASGTLSFSGLPGEVRTVHVAVMHDDQVEPDETFTLALGDVLNLKDGISPGQVFALPTPVAVTIINDDFDSDNDGVLDRNDNCPADANANQADTDKDGTGDVCDNDLDGDGVNNTADNCPLIANADQADLDLDKLGNLCDADADGDQMPNDYEIANGLNPLSSFDQRADPDRDGFTNIEEFRFGTDPNSFDADNDSNGVPDSVDRRRRVAPTIVPTIILPLLFEEPA